MKTRIGLLCLLFVLVPLCAQETGPVGDTGTPEAVIKDPGTPGDKVPEKKSDEKKLSNKEIDALIDSLENKDELERDKAVKSLKEAGRQIFRRVVEYGLKEKHHPLVKAKLVALLGSISTKESFILIKKYLASNIAEIRLAAMDAVEETNNEKLIYNLMPMVNSENELVRRKAVLILGKYGFKSSVSGLSSLLKSQYSHVQIAALKELRNYPEMKDMVVEDVAVLLKSEDAEVVLEATVTLKTLGDTRGEELFRTLLEEKDRNFQMKAVEYAGKYRIETAVPFLLKLLKNKDWYIRYSTVNALGRIKSPLALSSIKILFEDEQVLPVRIALARVLYGYKAPETLKFLVHKISTEKNVDIRWFIVATVSEIKSEKGIMPLITALMDSDEKIRLTAVMALRARTDRRFGYDARASKKERNRAVRVWEQWYKDKYQK